ncbi:hypothetical protein EIJ50_13300, partial [Xanthomonas perforans]
MRATGRQRASTKGAWQGPWRKAAIIAPGSRYHRGMAKLLLNLRNVPDDEADEVRALMREQRV